MAGGFIEGFHKVFAKGTGQKHIGILIISLIIGVVAGIAVAALPEKATEAQFYAYLFLKQPILGITILIFSIALGMYYITFVHNAIKFQVWKDNEQNEERIKALQIMPDWNKSLAAPLKQYLIFFVVWLIQTMLVAGICSSLARIPLIGLIPMAYAIIYLSVFGFSFPFMIALFAKNFDCKGLLGPLLPFKVLKKTFIPGLIYYLKMFVFIFIVSIVSIVAVLISAALVNILGKISAFLAVTIFFYISSISNLIAGYAAAVIVYEKYVLDGEE